MSPAQRAGGVASRGAAQQPNMQPDLSLNDSGGCSSPSMRRNFHDPANLGAMSPQSELAIHFDDELLATCAALCDVPTSNSPSRQLHAQLPTELGACAQAESSAYVAPQCTQQHLAPLRPPAFKAAARPCPAPALLQQKAADGMPSAMEQIDTDGPSQVAPSDDMDGSAVGLDQVVCKSKGAVARPHMEQRKPHFARSVASRAGPMLELSRPQHGPDDNDEIEVSAGEPVRQVALRVRMHVQLNSCRAWVSCRSKDSVRAG